MSRCRRSDFGCQLLSCLAIGLASLMMCALLSSPLEAQTTYGSIVGVVADASGAIIPEATITLTNIGTNEKRTAETDATGNYRFINLLPASYKLEVEKSGFKRVTREPVTVQVGSVVRIDAALEIGAITETVEVSAQTPLLQTESASLSHVVEGQQVQQMPLNGRNVTNLIAMTAGVVPQGSSMGSLSLNQGDHTNTQGWGNFQIGGGISGTNSMYVDGASVNVLHQNQVGLVITQDAIQEFNVATNSASAEFGRTGGGVVNMATKSGTNSFHGSAYEYFRNDVLNANTWQSNLAGAKRPPFRQNQYGANLGGPIIKDKVFFFFSWEGFKSRLGYPEAAYVPTDAQRNGIFTSQITIPSSYTAQTGLTTAQCISQPSSGVWQVNKDCYSPMAKWYLQNYWPTANANLASGNYYATPVIGDDSNQYTGRIDYNISDKQRLFGRFTYWGMTGLPLDYFGNTWAANNSSNNRAHQFVVGDTYTINPTTILDVRASYFRDYFDDNPPTLGMDMSVFGGSWSSLQNELQYKIIPALSFSGINLYVNRGSIDWYYANNYSINAGLTKMKGNHNLRVGAEFRLMDISIKRASRTSYTFNTNNPTGSPWAGFLLGLPTSTSIGTSSPVTDYNYYQGYYITDAWQVGRKLTLNLGLRWELPGGIAEKKDRATVLLPNASYTTASGTTVTGTLAMVNSSLYGDRSLLEVKHSLFAPRVGLAYRLTESTVVRTGYGLSYLPPDVQSSLSSSSSTLNSSSYSWDNTKVSTLSLVGDPFPAETGYVGGVPVNTGRSNVYFMDSYVNLSNPQSITGAYPYTPYAYVQQWNLSLGHQFAGNTMVEVGYAGSRGTHLPMSSTINLNELSSQYWAAANAYVAAGHTASQAISYFQKYRTYPYYSNVYNVAYYSGNSFYHSMQAKVERRFKNGGVLTANYTWSKNIGNTYSSIGQLEAKAGAGTTYSSTGAGDYQDYNNLAAEKSLSTFDVPHRLMISYVVDLPFGEGKKFGAGTKGVVNKLISGWSVNGITTFQSGFPLAIYGSSALSSIGGGSARPNVVAGCDPVISGSAQSRLYQWFNTACFADLPNTSKSGSSYFGVGNEARVDPVLRAAGVNNWDLSIAKATKIKESLNLQFRAEAFNLFNRVQFSPPDTNIDSSTGTFGVTLTQYNQPRLFQFSLRLSF